MNTQIYLWIEPMVMNHKRCNLNEKVYFNIVVEGNHSTLQTKELENLIEGKTMNEIMYFANIDCNWNYGAISSTATKKKPIIEYAVSPEKVEKEKAQKKEEIRISKIINSKKPILLTKDNMQIKDGGKIQVNLPELNVSQEIDIAKIWRSLEKQIIGKIKEGDVIKLTDDDGNVLFELTGGGFLNVGLADMSIYNTKEMDKTRSIFSHAQGLKGGLFVRDDGRLDIGDSKRTFYLQIYTNRLLKASLKINKSVNELTEIKLLNSENI